MKIIEEQLTVEGRKLFSKMNPSDQRHSLRVYSLLRESGERNSDLLAAALLHDVGKSLVPLTVFERVLIVLARKLFPSAVEKWGNEAKLGGIQRALIIAKNHPQWGAEMAASIGMPPLVVKLIRWHQEEKNAPLESPLEKRLLEKLQIADGKS